jgi:multiple sugar transport system ATP-binding protein
MSFLSVTAVSDVDGKGAFSFAGQAPVTTSVPFAGLPTSNLTFGIRAEAAHVDPNGAIEGVADVIERLGERSLIYTRLADGSTLVAEDNGVSTVQAGDPVRIAIDGNAAMVFDDAGKAYHAAA